MTFDFTLNYLLKYREDNPEEVPLCLWFGVPSGVIFGTVVSPEKHLFSEPESPGDLSNLLDRAQKLSQADLKIPQGKRVIIVENAIHVQSDFCLGTAYVDPDSIHAWGFYSGDETEP